MTIETLSIVIGSLGTLCAIFFGYHAFRKSTKKDFQDDGKKGGVLLTEIGYIKSGVDDIKRKQEKQDEQHIEVISRLTAVEASTKQAHKRMDVFEKKDNK